MTAELLVKTVTLRDRWADVDKTRHVYSTGRQTNLEKNGIGPCAADHPEISYCGTVMGNHVPYDVSNDMSFETDFGALEAYGC